MDIDEKHASLPPFWTFFATHTGPSDGGPVGRAWTEFHERRVAEKAALDKQEST